MSSPPPPAKDFSLGLSPTAITVAAGGTSSNFTVSAIGQNGFTGSVAIAFSGLPGGSTTSPSFPFNVAAGSSQNVTLWVPSSATAGNSTVTVSGTSGALSHSTQLALTVDVLQDFSISVSPNTVAADPGSNSSFTVSTAGQNGFSDPVTITLSGLPAGATTSPASPFTVTAGASQVVTMTIPSTTPAGNYAIAVAGTSGALNHSTALSLTVNVSGDFSIGVAPSTVMASAGSSGTSFTVSATGQNGFTAPVTIAISGLPADSMISPSSPFTVTPGSNQTMTLSVPPTASPVDYNVTVTGTSGAVSHATQFVLAIQSGTSVTTWHYDNARTSANTNEAALTPSNVNSASFGKLATLPLDGFVVGHPLYLPNVNVLGQGSHNVVYLATMHDSVYAFDADSGNTTPLWMTSILSYSPAGATSVPTSVTANANTTKWVEVGIVSTPVIDPDTGTLYLVAETYENGAVVHRLHALDVTSGLEKLGGPTTIAATYNLNGATTTFADQFEMNRPGLLLVHGHIYIGFGSNCCNAYSQGWVLSYNAATLQQEGAYTAEPGKILASIWQKGAGLSADSNGNVYAETGEGPFAASTNLSISVLKLLQTGTNLGLSDWFSPYNQQDLSLNDKDLNDAVLILPDQPGSSPHEAIAEGKEGTIYVLNRDNLGRQCTNCTSDTQIVQEIPQGAGRASGTPVYWNNTLYFTPGSAPVTAYTLSNGMLVLPPLTSGQPMGGSGHALITANGNTNGILWFINGGSLWAMDATTLNVLYTSDQDLTGRDTLPPLAHFATLIEINGKVFIGTQNSLVVYGLLTP